MSKKNILSKKILVPYCGMRSTPPNKRIRGTSEQCLKAGQVRYYGRMAVENSINQFLAEKKKLANEKAKIRRKTANEKKRDAAIKIKQANDAVKQANKAEKEAKTAEKEAKKPRGRPRGRPKEKGILKPKGRPRGRPKKVTFKNDLDDNKAIGNTNITPADIRKALTAAAKK